jgi:hypothetical protein
MMQAVIFLGPSLPVEQARARLDATYLPPVAQGEVWRAVVTLRPTVIGIVDGVFRHTPAVWHKEILFALAQGVHVFGAASMGALRAAELEVFGMRGVGVVFAAYRDGRLAPDSDAPFEDDDEVAVLHGPAETGWRPLSEALVDMRCSLAAAEAADVIAPAERTLICGVAKATFFAERSWPVILDRAVATGLDPGRRAALAAWLDHGCVAQKRADALLVLDEIRHFLAEPRAPFRPGFSFAHTAQWAAAVAEAGLEVGGPLMVLDELRLDPMAWRTTRRAALLDELTAAAMTPGRDEIQATLANLREHLGLADRRAIDAWCVANDAPIGLLEHLAETEAALRRLEWERTPYLLPCMLDRLRSEGRYPALRARAAAKAVHHAAASIAETEADAPDDLYVLSWYFGHRLGTAIPDDLEEYARDLGFADAHALRRALWREFRFVMAAEAAPEPA